MSKSLKWLSVALVVLALVSCDEIVPISYECDPEASNIAFAVVRSDYASTAVDLLDENGCVLESSWVDSGSELPGLSAALSGDVILANHQPAEQLTIIDRGNQVVTKMQLMPRAVIGQVVTHGPDAPQAIYTNPHDVQPVSETSAWISRYGFGVPESTPENGGMDLLEINPATMQRTGQRIDLNECDDELYDCSAPARPAFMARVGNYLVVTLNRIGDDFMSAATGAVALVDLDDSSVTLHEFAGLKNCLNLVPVPGAPNRLLLSCWGFAETFGDEAATRATGGSVYLEIDSDAGLVTETARFSPASDNNLPLAQASAVPLSSAEFVAVDFGNFEVGDRLYHVTVGGTEPVEIAASGAFEIGTPVFDAARNLLLVPDANESTGGIRRFQYEAGGFTELERIPVDAALPARHVYQINK